MNKHLAHTHKLDQMMGLAWMYRTKVYHFVNYRIDNGKVTLVTKERWFDWNTEEEALAFLHECLEVEETEYPTVNAPAQIKKQENNAIQISRPDSSSGNLFAYLCGILVEDIDKVREDPSYVEQAKTVSNNTKRVIDIARLEMQLQVLNQKKAQL